MRPVPAQCQSYAALADLERGTILPLFERKDQPSEVVANDISPDGNRLLYKTDRQLYVLNLDTFDAEKLKAPMGARGQWLDDDSLLLSYIPRPSMPNVVGVFDVQESKLYEIAGLGQAPQLKNLWILDEKPSPDGNWLTFTAGKDIYSADGLWLARLVFK